MLKLIDSEKIEKWIEEIEHYDYDVLPFKEQQVHMKLILTARLEAYKNVLSLLQ